MKPLPVAPLTVDDVAVWIFVCHRFRPSKAAALLIGGAAVDADRSDAAVMLRLVYMRSLLTVGLRPRGYRRKMAHTVLSGHILHGKDPGTAFNIPTPTP